MSNAFHYQNTFDDTLSANFKGLLSMGFDPRQLGSLEAWLDARKDYPVKVAGSASISQWRDKSQFQKHAVQSSASVRPTYSAAEPSVAFNLSFLDWGAFDDSRIQTANQLTLALRIKLRSSSAPTPQAIIAKGNYDTTNIYLDFFQEMLRYKLGNSALFTHDISGKRGQWATIILKASEGFLSFQMDGALVTSSLPYGAIGANAAPLLIGARTFQGAASNFLSDSNIKHISIFSSALSSEETALLQAVII